MYKVNEFIAYCSALSTFDVKIYIFKKKNSKPEVGKIRNLLLIERNYSIIIARMG